MADGIIGYPFDSIVTFDEQGNPTFDRAVSSKVLKTLISKLFTTGVMPNPSNNLLVTSGTEGMTTVVEEGFCVIEGGLKLIAEPQTMMHQASDTNYDRIDTVVMRWDNNDNVRHCGLFVVAGTPATSPVRPTLTREGSIYEIGLADVLIKANSTVISANRITDTRYDDERCGVVRSISEYDTTYIYQQVQADLAGFKENEQAEFLAWFETIRGILDEDVAGHLQNEIDDLRLNGGNSNLAPVESSTTATVATNAGKYVVVEGVLYKALSNIAIGDTYVSSGAGANIERKLVGDELAGINQNLTQILNPEYVEVVSDGSKKLHSILAELYTLVELTKVSSNTYMYVDIPNIGKQHFTLEFATGSTLVFEMSYTTKQNGQYVVHRNAYIVASDGSQKMFSADTSATSTTFGESSVTDAPPSGRVFRIYYK